MPENKKTLIMKFGGAAVATAQHFSDVASLVIKKSFEYPQIAIVVSAMKGMTDHLIKLAQLVHPQPPRREYDMLVSAGERMSIALLAMALAHQGREAVSFTGSQSGIITCSDHSEAKILDVKPLRLLQALREEKIVIVAGFQGVSTSKEITTLGRGGSDTSAVALGVALNAECVEFYKDVTGIYDTDPKKNPHAKQVQIVSFQEALKIVENTGGKVLHPRAIRLAEKNELPLHVRSFQSAASAGTWIGSVSSKRKEEKYYEA